MLIKVFTECEMCFIAEENFFPKNCLRPPVVQTPIPKIYDVVNGQLASLVVCTGLYMDVSVDLKPQYAIMCRKTSGCHGLVSSMSGY